MKKQNKTLKQRLREGYPKRLKDKTHLHCIIKIKILKDHFNYGNKCYGWKAKRWIAEIRYPEWNVSFSANTLNKLLNLIKEEIK